jgi:integrase
MSGSPASVITETFTPRGIDLGALTLPEARKVWLTSRKPFIGKKTYADYGKYLVPLVKFFGTKIRLAAITSQHIRDYQNSRLQTCGASAINHELCVLVQMLKRARLWSAIADDYQPLPLPKSECGIALSDAESERLIRIAGSNPDWISAYLYILLGLNTTAGPSEVLTLRLMDVDLEKQIIRIQPEGAKNEWRVRVIPLNQTALGAVRLALDRARECGSGQPQHYLFPFRVKRNMWDPTRPQDHQDRMEGDSCGRRHQKAASL